MTSEIVIPDKSKFLQLMSDEGLSNTRLLYYLGCSEVDIRKERTRREIFRTYETLENLDTFRKETLDKFKIVQEKIDELSKQITECLIEKSKLTEILEMIESIVTEKTTPIHDALENTPEVHPVLQTPGNTPKPENTGQASPAKKQKTESRFVAKLSPNLIERANGGVHFNRMEDEYAPYTIYYDICRNDPFTCECKKAHTNIEFTNKGDKMPIEICALDRPWIFKTNGMPVTCNNAKCKRIHIKKTQ